MIIFEQKKLGIFCTIALVLVTMAQLFYYHPLLPDRIASHFNLMMQPDRWSPKNAVMLLDLSLILAFAGLFHLIAWVIGKFPTSWINLPNKDYWMRPERKGQTLNQLATFFIWLGNVTLLFIVVTFNLTYQANLSPGQKAHNFWVALGLFLITLAFMIYHLFKRFSTIPKST